MAQKVSHKRWRFAQQNEREYQTRKASTLGEKAGSIALRARTGSLNVARYLKDLKVFNADGFTVEIGSGASGLIWNWPSKQKIAIDPLAHFFKTRFSSIQPDDVLILEARGEQIPLGDGCADTVLSDNVLDHVEDPLGYLQECRRILSSDGVLYMTVDIHHPFYWWIGRLYNLVFSAGVKLNVPAFPHHPFHFTYSRISALVDKAGLKPLAPPHATAAPVTQGRGLITRIQQQFYKNTRLELVLTH